MRGRGVVSWTIGQGNRSIGKFLTLLGEHKIEALVDVRSFPKSNIEYFKREKMERWLLEHGIEYVWLGEELGGYRLGGYKAHMKPELFREGIEKLLEVAKERRVCILCMEKNTKYCHRRFLTAYMERRSVEVVHLLEEGQVSLMKFKDIIVENYL